MKEQEGDYYLNIQTTGTQWIAEASLHHNRYEPTPYVHLKELFNRYPLEPDDGLVDFGCGKGRLNFYVHDRFGCRTTGIEMNTSFCNEAKHNLESYCLNSRRRSGRELIRFYCGMAQEYDIRLEDNVFYFFNPFSVQVFMKVVDNILKSAEAYPRKMDIILYYPSKDYINFLERNTAFELKETIDLPGVHKDPAEQFLIYRFTPED
ncbi:class I SAM-dependent methyltransferase [Planococcus sp. CAU13]|uniref:class I SAM-dependent methyltransferase n=1 Tax=Planococcus sp. CAU13 TaxID=1541197 RepID=UPI00052FEE18|nr:class I SAM-dependent methyltransferase [Planococcus sp. CAU13]